MKVIFSILFFSFGNFVMFAQQTELVIKYFSSKQISEQYSVLKTNKSIRQGKYIAYFAAPNNALIEVKSDTSKLKDYVKTTGFYENGQKQGVWVEYLTTYAKKSKGNYTQGKKTGIWETYQEKGLVVERFDYDKNEKLEPLFYLPLIPYPQKSKYSGIDGKVTLSYSLNSDCSISNVRVIKSLNEECDNTVLKMFKQTLAIFYPKYCFNCEVKSQILDVNFLGFNPNDY